MTPISFDQLSNIGIYVPSGAGTTSEFLSSADSRETSRELMDAILYVAGGDAQIAVRVWEDPSDAETLAVWERVTNNGQTPSNEFCWGVAGSAWARELGVEAA